MGTQQVRSVSASLLENDKRPIDQWITNLKDLHAKKSAPVMKYNRKFKDVESLMQVWPPEIEEILDEPVIIFNLGCIASPRYQSQLEAIYSAGSSCVGFTSDRNAEQGWEDKQFDYRGSSFDFFIVS